MIKTFLTVPEGTQYVITVRLFSSFSLLGSAASLSVIHKVNQTTFIIEVALNK